ncbi:kinase-like protein [Athelia psychrophila]|uniref:Kinase-like protein n=1 Tax=Athelia psychrophila TaxID=1759441 RepID=A0A166CMT6_9AGAM|nr:kinase-like protein [Fibularhizoctonia sp. CBS 109695]
MDDSDIDASGSSILDAPTRDSFDFQSSRIDRSRARAAADILVDITDDVQQVTVGKLRRKCILLAGRCNFFKLALEHDLPTAIPEGDLEASTDEMLAWVFVTTRAAVRLEASVSAQLRVVSERIFYNNPEMKNDIEEELHLCDAELGIALSIFSPDAIMREMQDSTIGIDTISLNDTADLLMQIMSSDRFKPELARTAKGSYSMMGRVAVYLQLAGKQRVKELTKTSAVQLEADTSFSTLSCLRKAYHAGNARLLEWEKARISQVLQDPEFLSGTLRSIHISNDDIERTRTYADTWEGRWMDEEKVALKALHHIVSGEKMVREQAQQGRVRTEAQRFRMGMRDWNALQHPHILTGYGTTSKWDQFHLVSPWQDFGNVLQYVRTRRVDNRIHLLAGAAEGIAYLHENGIVHGNLKCANIVVGADREARICDFGLSAVIEQITGTPAVDALIAAGCEPWLAPELIDRSITSPSMLADTYSFAMSMMELLAGDGILQTFPQVLQETRRTASMHLPRPDSPEALYWLTDSLWSLMQQCWVLDPLSRPSMDDVALSLMSLDAAAPRSLPEPQLSSTAANIPECAPEPLSMWIDLHYIDSFHDVPRADPEPQSLWVELHELNSSTLDTPECAPEPLSHSFNLHPIDDTHNVPQSDPEPRSLWFDLHQINDHVPELMPEPASHSLDLHTVEDLVSSNPEGEGHQAL